MKNFFIGVILAAGAAFIVYLSFLKPDPCPECKECPDSLAHVLVPPSNRQALLSVADIALNRKSKSLAEAESLVKFDKEFYLDFYYNTALSDKYFYARHGSCCPCSDGGRGCCACVSGSAFGAPHSASLITAIDSKAGSSLYTFASYSAQQKPNEPPPLKLKIDTIGDTDVFTVPAGTAPNIYRVTFKGKFNFVMDIDVKADGGFDVTDPLSIVKH